MSDDNNQLDLFGFASPEPLRPTFAAEPAAPDPDRATVLQFSRTERRLLCTAEEICIDDADRITYMHTVLCETAPPVA